MLYEYMKTYLEMFQTFEVLMWLLVVVLNCFTIKPSPSLGALSHMSHGRALPSLGALSHMSVGRVLPSLRALSHMRLGKALSSHGALSQRESW